MKSKILVLFVLFVCSSFARPIVFNINRELKEADRIVKGKIWWYEDGILSFKNSETGLMDSAYVLGRLLSKPIQENNDITVVQREKSILSNCIPMIGEEVLIVINDKNDIRMFAYENNEYYRFWSPKMANSLTLFNFESPALPIFPNDSFYNVGVGQCFDGCLYPINKIELRQ